MKRFNMILENEKAEEQSVLVRIFKNKVDLHSCTIYKWIKLMSHTMKIWETVMEARVRDEVMSKSICVQRYGFMPRTISTEAMFALTMLMEK